MAAADLSPLVLQALPVAIYTTDPDGRITFYNDAASELWGHRPDLGSCEFCGSWKLYHADGRPMPHDQCPMAVALRERRAIRGVEAIAERPDGTRVPFIPYPTPLFDDSGAFIGAVNMLVDISENDRLHQSARLLSAIVAASDDAIVSKDLNGTITSWNKGAERLFGHTAEEAIGKHITMVIPPQRLDEEPRILDQIRRGERIEHFETVRVRKDGTLVDISLTVSPIKDSSGRIVGASKIARDITERKQVQARQDLLTREVHHRTKNLFAVVQAVVTRSFAGKKTVEEAETTVLSRIHSLAQTHAMLIEREWRGADISDVIRAGMSPHSGRVKIKGPSLMLSARAAQNFALALHELATNAVKYGALSNATGHVDISWSVTPGENGSNFVFRWQERGGPTVGVPARRGFGSVVLEQVMGQYVEVCPQIDFAPGGFTYTLEGSLASVATDD